jgi:MscS family membrane protein
MTPDDLRRELTTDHSTNVKRAKLRVSRWGLLIAVIMLSSGVAPAQSLLQKATSQAAPPSAAAPIPPVPEEPKDPLGRDTPYGTVVGFLKAAEQGDWKAASDFLDSKQQPDQKLELARQLKLVMDKGLTLDISTLSKDPEGSPKENLRRTRNEVGTAKIGDQSLLIFVDRIQPTAKRPPYWLFSAETLSQVPNLAGNLEVPWFDAYIPDWLMENRLLGIPVFRWIAIPLGIALTFGVVLLITWIAGLLIRAIFRLAPTSPVLRAGGFLGPVRVLILAYLIYATAPLAQTLVARQMWRGLVAPAVTIVGLAWFVMRILDLLAELAVARSRKRERLPRIAHLRLSHWVLKASVAVVALVALLYKVGINPGTVLTGLGLGGVALAFAAQKTIENVFGTVMIVADQPLRVGDFCKIGDTLGTIEDIGLRSTRVRTLNHTLVTVPNGQLASMVVENYASRDKIWFRHAIGLRYETSADQLRYVLAEIRALLQNHPKVESGTSRVRFIRLANSSLELEIFAYIMISDYAEFLGVQEELLLQIMDIVEKAGTGIAFPSQTTYLARDSRSDARKKAPVIEPARARGEAAHGS